MERIRIGILGIGRIARDQHIPTLQKSSTFELVACASRNATVDGVANFGDLNAMLSGCPDMDAVAICTPPQVHYEAARLALQRGKHVLLEKPPCATTMQLDQLARHARKAERTLFQTWHSQHAAAVDAAQGWLKSRTIKSARITWKEDVCQWHPGQTWIWQAGGFGVFDPGINAISILTRIVPQPIFVKAASLFVPANCETPIAAHITFITEAGAPIAAEFDFRHTGVQTWNIDVQTVDGALKLSNGGSLLFVDEKPVVLQQNAGEYASLYSRFAELIDQKSSEVDTRPFQLVADAFLVGRWLVVEPFAE